MRKIYSLDTNVLLNLMEIFDDEKFNDGKFAISLVVISELDAQKNDKERGEVSFKARRATRKIKELLSEGKIEIIEENFDYMPVVASEKSYNDNLILSSTKHRDVSTNDEVVLVTNDLNLQLRAEGIEVNVMAYEPKVTRDLDFTGIETVEVTFEVMDKLYKTSKIYPKKIDKHQDDFLPNSGIIITDGSREMFTVFDPRQNVLVKLDDMKLEIGGLKPKNREQKLYMHLLMNEDIRVVASNSLNGSGKSLLSIAYAFDKIQDSESPIKKIMYLKSPAKVGGEGIGFLAGSKEDKVLGESYGAFIDTLQVLYGHNKEEAETTLHMMIEKGEIEVEDISFIRGRNLDNMIVILDEAQNVPFDIVRTVMGRITENSKVFIIGDVSQIDARFLNKFNNGLTMLINNNKYKEADFTGSVNMTKAERSRISQLVQDMILG